MIIIIATFLPYQPHFLIIIITWIIIQYVSSISSLLSSLSLLNIKLNIFFNNEYVNKHHNKHKQLLNSKQKIDMNPNFYNMWKCGLFQLDNLDGAATTDKRQQTES